jgi:hypothetical protein
MVKTIYDIGIKPRLADRGNERALRKIRRKGQGWDEL